MKNLSTRAVVIIAASVLLFVIVSIIYILNTSSPQSDQTNLQPTPTRSVSRIVPPVIRDAPTIAPDQGGGIDTNSPMIRTSTNEIQKLVTHMPYEEEFTSSTGITVTILIPQQNLQANSWTIKSQVFGINYNTSPEQSDYEIMKTSFLEAAERVFSWVRQNGASPEKIIYVWGDRKFIQDQAVKWLSE